MTNFKKIKSIWAMSALLICSVCNCSGTTEIFDPIFPKTDLPIQELDQTPLPVTFSDPHRLIFSDFDAPEIQPKVTVKHKTSNKWADCVSCLSDEYEQCGKENVKKCGMTCCFTGIAAAFAYYSCLPFSLFIETPLLLAVLDRSSRARY